MVLPANGLLGMFGGPEEAAELDDDEADDVAVLDAEVLEPHAAKIVEPATAAPMALRRCI